LRWSAVLRSFWPFNGFGEHVGLVDSFGKGQSHEQITINSKYIISNGVLNLTPDKKKTLSEWERVLKPGGRLYIGDILVPKSIPQSALEDISLWTG